MTSSGNIAEFTESLRPSVHREAFTKSREELFNPSVLFFYDPNAKPKMETDAAGIGGHIYVCYGKSPSTRKISFCSVVPGIYQILEPVMQ